MTKTKISIYLALIFIAGAIAGGALVLSSPRTFSHNGPPRGHPSPEEFANHVWNQLKDRLKLTDKQAAEIEPVFRAGFAEVRAIQDKSLQDVEAAICKNHEQISSFLTEDQKRELQKMREERQDFLKHRGHRPPPPGGRPPNFKAPPQ
jgi:hypothetical protein